MAKGKDFLADLGSAVKTTINQQFGFGENPSTEFDFGDLGEFAGKFDQSASRTYIEDGLISNVRPRMREVLFQEPDLTIVVKKKMFSSLIENFKQDLLEEKEQIFIRASKKLIENKCKLMAAYERLSKVEQVSRESGQFNTSLIPIVMQDISTFTEFGLNNVISSETLSNMESLRQAMTFSETSNFTTWTTDIDQVFSGPLGAGTGTFELTVVSDLNTTSSVEPGAGSCSFNIEDPYRILQITQRDIDQAISDAQNFFRNSPFGAFTDIELKNKNEQLKNRLNAERLARGVSPLRFIISPQSFFSKKVRAVFEMLGREVNYDYNPGVVGIGDGVDIDEKELISGGVPLGAGETERDSNRFNDYEAELFKQIIKNLYNIIGQQNTTQVDIKNYNNELNYVRNRMRLFFKGKSIIQHLDVVNVFMTTKTTKDAELTVGFPGFNTTGDGNIGQNINNLIRNINAVALDFSGNKTSPDEIEKAAIVGPSFPTWLWRMFRNNFTKQGAGTAVFVGIVKGVEQRYADGKYTLSITCEDNFGYFRKSQVQFKPALDSFVSALYDPLTPFDVSFDASSGKDLVGLADGQLPPLLKENSRLLNTQSVKNANGDKRGDKANQVLYKSQKGEVVFGRLRKVLTNVEGFVYRWKQGIGSYTMNQQPASQPSGSDTSPLLTSKAFAGQDVMNVLSLLMTGQPYNFNTFISAARKNANSSTPFDPTDGDSDITSYIDGITRDLSKRNILWGSFIPFKELMLNDAAYSFARKGQFDLTKQQDRLNDLVKQRAQKLDKKLIQVGGTTAEVNTVGLDEDIAELDTQISLAEAQFSDEESELYHANTGNISIVGDDISYDSNFSEYSGDTASTDEEKDNQRRELRLQVNSLALRRLWKVKGNSDVNYLIVDDQYDKNFDIMAFERTINGTMELFNSEYSTVEQQITNVAAILGLEVFADTQGHIRVQPPGYNKMPSSVFYKMFKDKDESGVKVFPDTLEKLMFNQIDGMINKLEIVEDQVRLRVILLGGVTSTGNDSYSTDTDIERFINTGEKSSGATSFKFISDPNTGSLNTEVLKYLQEQANPDTREQSSSTSIDALRTQSGVTRAFSSASKATVSNSLKLIKNKSIDEIGQNSRAIAIRSRLKKNKNVDAKTARDFFVGGYEDKASNVSIIQILDEISNFVAERQRVVRVLSSTVKNLTEAVIINSTDSSEDKVAKVPFLNRKTTIPSMLEHLIEDEEIDDWGPGSGERFIINENQIISKSYSENAPDFTAVQVNGLFAEGFAGAPGSLNANLSGNSGGNFMTSAYAVDYDMWSQYGFRAANSIHAPWASNPEAQCAPFAVHLLNMERKKIFTGTIEISGWNEFYQPSDVIYIESDDLLFYVTSVSHSFSFGGSLSTKLTLAYGRNPGEYIPTHLDMVGKFLYNSQTYSNSARSSREGVEGDDISLGAIIASTGVTTNSLISGPNGAHNTSVLDKLLYSAVGALTPNYSSDRIRPRLELRIYGRDGNVSSNADYAAKLVRIYLTNPARYTSISGEVSDVTGRVLKLEASDVDIVAINTSDTVKSPSGSAWNTVRLIEQAGSEGSGVGNDEVNTKDIVIINDQSADVLDDILEEHIVDAFVTYVPVEDTESEVDQKNQAAEEGNAAVKEAQSKGP